MEQKKTNPLRKGIALALALALIAGTFFMLPTKAADTSALGQLIDGFTAAGAGVVFDLNASSRFFFTSEPTGELLQTVQLVQRQLATDGIPSAKPLDIVWGNASMVRDGDILIKLVDEGAAPAGVDSDEGYHLSVGAHTVVTAYGVDGLLYGLNMLHKHLRNTVGNNGTFSIHGFTAYDTPDTKERAVHLDIARKYMSKDWICNYVKEISWMGYNALELHFSEDGGFRIDIWDPQYFSSPTGNDFTWLAGSEPAYWVYEYNNDPDINKYLTAAELIEIFNVCKEYHIDVIPSFDTPAHVGYITKKYYNKAVNPYNKVAVSSNFTYDSNGDGQKESYTLGEKINYKNEINKWNYACLNLGDAKVRYFAYALYTDLAAFFKQHAGSTHFNIGGDEVSLSSKATDNWNYADFISYVNDVNSILKNQGYSVRMYNDFLDRQDYINKARNEGSTVPALDSDIAISYWDSPDNYGSTSATGVNRYGRPGEYFVNQNRTIYSGVQNWTYYVLRIFNTPGYERYATFGQDARDPEIQWWSFQRNEESRIYNEWCPTLLTEYGQTEYNVTDSRLGGGYFYIWCDYPTLNTEVELWNGVYDQTNTNRNGKVHYSLRNRMWSNIIKMWNWDINNSLSFNNFASLRNSLGDFPGLQTTTYSDKSYAKATSLRAGSDPIQLGDHAALSAALATKYSQGYYTDASYSAYLTAYAEAERVNNNNSATDTELTKALNDLNAAIQNLTKKIYRITVAYKSMINGVETLIESKGTTVYADANSYKILVPYMDGYEYIRTENSAFQPSESGDGSGYLVGTATSDLNITVWLENNVDLSYLNALIAESITSQALTDEILYTSSSWSAYQTALSRAKAFSLSVTSKQSDVDALVNDLEHAKNGLVADHPAGNSYLLVELLNTFEYGKQVGMKIKTSPNVKSITIWNQSHNHLESATVYTSEVQTLDDGTVVKYWLVMFQLNYHGSTTFEIIGTYDNNGTEQTVSALI